MTLLTANPSVTFLREYAETRRYLAGRPVSPEATPDGRYVVFLRSGAKDTRQLLYELDVTTGATRELASPESLLQGASESLSVEEKARLERQRIGARGFTHFELSADGTRVLTLLSGKPYVVDRVKGSAVALKPGAGGCIDPHFTPDGKSVVYVRDNDVHVIDVATNVERRITKGGTENRPHGLAEFVAQEEMSRFSGFWVSPDGKSLVFQETDLTGVERMAISDPSKPTDEPIRFPYPRPGHKNATVRLGVVPMTGGTPVWLTWDSEEFSYVATVRWKNGPLTVVVQNREQTREVVLSADPKTGKTTPLLLEEDAAWINLDQHFPLWWKDVGFFWRTERNGADEIELRRPDGGLIKSWVHPEAGIDELAGFDPATKTLFFTGGRNPTQPRLWRVIDGGAPELINTPPGSITGELAGGGHFVLSHTSTKGMPQTVVTGLDGAVLRDLPSVALEPSLPLHVEIAQLENDGPWTAVFTPSGFVKGKKYPVVLGVYGGPRHLEVIDSTREHLMYQWLAEQGYLVVKIDGRGTPKRTRAWERAISHDFATITGGDQVAGLKALAKKMPELDLSRVGVYGWSFGGYLSALLALEHGDTVKTAVAGAPVVDWRDYDTHYTERYLGLVESNPKGYEVSSLLSHLKDTSRPMLIIHGTADDNVYFLHSLKLSEALFRAGKSHAVLPLINQTHMVLEPETFQRQWERISAWFAESLKP